MIFRQFFDSVSSTYTYLIASGKGREALIIDPVLEKTDQYIKLLHELDLRLVKVIDTHIHADHISGIAELRDKTKCITIMGEHAPGDVVSMSVKDNESVSIEKIHLKALYTPGHTDDSYSFLMNDRVFTGDTLLIKGTGRTDFQNGDPYDAYNSIFERLLKLPEETLIYPAHDYKGESVSTIGEEKKFNPRLQVSSADEYAKIMNNLCLFPLCCGDEICPSASMGRWAHADAGRARPALADRVDGRTRRLGLVAAGAGRSQRCSRWLAGTAGRWWQQLGGTARSAHRQNSDQRCPALARS